MEPVKILSGGEKNRVSLAKMFSKPANLLILDEPTNDLDIEMLEVLEERLVQFEGTMIIVSHDRNFLDNVVTSVLVFEDDGSLGHYVGNYSDWAKRGKNLRVAEEPVKQNEKLAESRSHSSKPTAGKKLSYKLNRELEMLPAEIESLEKDIDKLQLEIGEPAFYDQEFALTEKVLATLSEKQQLLDSKTERWIELEELAAGA